MTTAREAFEAKYQRSADDPASAEMLAVFTEGWEASRDGARALMPEPFATLHDDGFWTMKPGTEPNESRYAGWRREIYTAAQMLEIAQAADKAATERERERFSKICDEIASKHWQAYKRGSDPATRANPHTEGQSDGAGECADAIRETK